MGIEVELKYIKRASGRGFRAGIVYVCDIHYRRKILGENRQLSARAGQSLNFNIFLENMKKILDNQDFCD